MKRERKVKQKRHTGRNVLIYTGALITVVAALFLPDTLFAVQEQNEYTQVGAVDKKYVASSSSLARTVSENLTTYDKVQMAAGQWESERQAAEDYEMEQEDYEVIALARQKIKELYDVGLYPVDLSSEYANWYTWTITPYKIVDTTFHTYTAYCWEIRFEKYDKSETHIIQMIEDGTIYMAKAEVPERQEYIGVTSVDLDEMRTPKRDVTSLNDYHYNVKALLPYAEDTSSYDMDSLTWITQDGISYLLFQFFGRDSYMYALTPSL